MLRTKKMRFNFSTFPVSALILIVFFMVSLTGCGEETPSPAQPPPPKKVAKEQVPKAGGDSTMEEVSEPEPPAYVYDPVGRRDPFQPYTALKRPLVDSEPLTPLQKFDLAQLRLIAVIIGKGEPRAMILAPDGKSYILKKGIKIGKQNGTVVEIKPEAVSVKERYYDFSGEIRTDIKEIKLPEREGAL